MNRRIVIFGAVVLVILAGAAVLALVSTAPQVYRFPGVVQPRGNLAPPPVRVAAVSDFDRGSVHRLAVLVTDPGSDWLGLARGLKSHGVPFTMTTDPVRALAHRVVFVYPTISGRALAPTVIRSLAEHVHAGGALVSFDVEGGGLDPLFGVSGPPRPDRVDRLLWAQPPGPDGETQSRINRAGTEDAQTPLAYSPAGGQVVARYADGAAAVVCARHEGVACVIGVELGALSERALNGRGELIGRAYDNAYEPSLDLLYDWIAGVYVAGEPAPWLIGTAPPGRDLSILLTHDIDFTRAVHAGRRTADALAAAGARATFFLQTKYVRDDNDDIFFRAETLPDMKAMLADGMEVGSHSVAHAPTFADFPFGDGHERYPDYRPFVESRSRAHGGAILGEVGVSKWLLEHLVGAKILSFRAGYLAYPFRLPDALAAAGYRYDSSVTADSTLTHLPYRLSMSRQDQALAPVWEFPVTIEDEAPPALPRRLGAADDVLGRIASRRGLAVILVHPDPAGTKLGFETALVSQWKGRAWFPTLGEFGDWWSAREETEAEVSGTPGHWTLTVPPGRARHLAIILPRATAAERLAGAAVVNGREVRIEGLAQAVSVAFH